MVSTGKRTIPLCTIQGLRSTILIDKYVSRWFLFLILEPSFKARSEGLPVIQAAYQTIRRYEILLWFLGGGIGLSFLGALEMRNYVFVFSALAGMFLFFRTLAAKKKQIADISLYFIEHDFPPEALAKTTLYQIGEVYSETYKIPSLVDTLYRLDKIYRVALVFSFFWVAYITHITFFIVRQVAFIVLFFGVAFIVNRPFFYRRFR
ncbi:MAG: hypothetical protein WC450_06900 [Candidatus Omnitrophota bacterium]